MRKNFNIIKTSETSSEVIIHCRVTTFFMWPCENKGMLRARVRKYGQMGDDSNVCLHCGNERAEGASFTLPKF